MLIALQGESRSLNNLHIHAHSHALKVVLLTLETGNQRHWGGPRLLVCRGLECAMSFCVNYFGVNVTSGGVWVSVFRGGGGGGQREAVGGG